MTLFFVVLVIAHLNTYAAVSFSQDACRGLQVTPYELDLGYIDDIGYVAKEQLCLEGEYVRYIVDEGLFIRFDEVELTDAISEVIENVTGLKYKNKINIFVKANTPNVTYLNGDIYLSGIDLVGIDPMAGDMMTTVHELAHALYLQNGGNTDINELFVEGFATYTEVKAMDFVVENNIEQLKWLTDYFGYYLNMVITDANILTSEQLTYWMNNRYPACMNGNYGLGAAYMAYLDNVYGDYSSWIDKMGNGFLTSDEQISLVNSVYPQNTESMFYTWISENIDTYTPKGINVYECNAELLKLLGDTYWYKNYNYSVENAYGIRFNTELGYDETYIEMQKVISKIKEKYPNCEYKYSYDDFIFVFKDGYSDNNLFHYRYADRPFGNVYTIGYFGY